MIPREIKALFIECLKDGKVNKLQAEKINKYFIENGLVQQTNIIWNETKSYNIEPEKID